MGRIELAIAQLQGQLGALKTSARQTEAIMKMVLTLVKNGAVTPSPSEVSHLTTELMSIYKDLDRIPGKIVTYTPSGELEFDVSNEGAKSNKIPIQISTDGPFIQTSYPIVSWTPIEPTATPGPRATDFGIRRPVSLAYLPSQQFQNNFIEVSWELESGGSQRAQQNSPAQPFFSRPDYNNRLPQPYVWRPNDSIGFFAVFNRISFGGDVATTKGRLDVSIPGYRIVDS